MALFSSEEDDSSDDEGQRQTREQLIKKTKEEQEAFKKRRRDEEAASEAKWFSYGKHIKTEALTLGQLLEKKTMYLTADQKPEFTQTIPEVVAHFKSCALNDFDEELKGITDDDELIRFIRKAHERITTKIDEFESPDNMRLHKFFEKYEKEVVAALKDATGIPKDEENTDYKYQVVFHDARRSVLATMLVNLMREDEEKKKEERRERELREKEICDRVTREFLIKCRIGTNAYTEAVDDDALVRELAELNFRALQLDSTEEYFDRPTSPTPPEFSAAALAQIDQIASQVKVKSTARDLPGTVHEPEVKLQDYDSGDDETDDVVFLRAFMSYSEEPQPEEAPESKVEEVFARNEGPMSSIRSLLEDLPSDEDKPPEEDKEKYIIGENRSILDSVLVKEEGMIIDDMEEDMTGEDVARIRVAIRKASAKILQRNDGSFVMDDEMDKKKINKRRLRNVNKDGRKQVRFEPFDSPVNKMRVFVKPNNALSVMYNYDQDDGPTLEWKDYGLKEGWHELHRRRLKFPLTCKEQPQNPYTRVRKTNFVQRLTENIDRDWIHGFKGNLLGRFWFLRDPEYDLYLREVASDPYYDADGDDDEERDLKMKHEYRRDYGVLRQYTQKEVAQVFSHNWSLMREGLYETMFRSHSRNGGGEDKKQARVSNVLILTDWRLVYLNFRAAKNAVVKFLPTQIGAPFFEALGVFLSTVLLDIDMEISTIIFAFGGGPNFKIEDFQKFWTKLTVHALKSVDIHWFAQDWLDGLPATPEQHEQLNTFNANVNLCIDSMRRSGMLNYHWHNLRQLYNIKLQPPIHISEPDTMELEPIYNVYIRHFVNYCNVFTNKCFHVATNRLFDDHPENSSIKPVTSIVYTDPARHEDDENDWY